MSGAYEYLHAVKECTPYAYMSDENGDHHDDVKSLSQQDLKDLALTKLSKIEPLVAPVGKHGSLTETTTAQGKYRQLNPDFDYSILEHNSYL